MPLPGGTIAALQFHRFRRCRSVELWQLSGRAMTVVTAPKPMWCWKPDRGKLVEISEEWLVNFTTQKTIRDRKHERIVEKSAIGWNLSIKEIKPQLSEWD